LEFGWEGKETRRELTADIFPESRQIKLILL
jgi:hypothetical protein